MLKSTLCSSGLFEKVTEFEYYYKEKEALEYIIKITENIITKNNRKKTNKKDNIIKIDKEENFNNKFFNKYSKKNLSDNQKSFISDNKIYIQSEKVLNDNKTTSLDSNNINISLEKEKNNFTSLSKNFNLSKEKSPEKDNNIDQINLIKKKK